MNVWDLIIGRNKTTPRYEIPIDENTFIQSDYKLFNGTTIRCASWAGYFFPKASTPEHEMVDQKLNCESKPCLFKVAEDITQHNNIADEDGDLVEKLVKRLGELKKGYYVNNNEKGYKTLCPSDIEQSDCASWMAVNHYNGFCGPYI